MNNEELIVNSEELNVGASIARPFRKNQGITLIALMITIIVMLILAGVVLNLTIGERGIFNTAKKSGEEYIKQQIKEEIELAIVDIQAEELSKGNSVTVQTLQNGQLANKLQGIVAELKENQICGEYKEYDYIIKENLEVEIGGKLTGAKPTGIVEILTQGITQETVEIKVTGNIEEGTIKSIIATNGANLKTDISNNEKIFTVNKNGTYNFKITGENGRSVTIKAYVKNILEKPVIEVKNITGTECTVVITNDYDDSIKFTYYLNDVEKLQNVNLKTCKIENLTENTTYKIRVSAIYESMIVLSEETTIETLKKPSIPIVQTNYDMNRATKTTLDLPILTTNGVMNCKIIPEKGSNLELKILNQEEGLNYYYSLDGGITWNKYVETIKTQYQEEGLIKFKAVNKEGMESCENVIVNYVFDEEQNCTNSQAISKEAYDRNPETYATVSYWQPGYFDIDPSCIGLNVSMVWDCSKCGNVRLFGFGYNGYPGTNNVAQLGERCFNIREVDNRIGISCGDDTPTKVYELFISNTDKQLYNKTSTVYPWP